MEVDSMSAAIRCVIDGMPDGTCFFGNELKKKVVRVYPEARHAYVASVLHCMRRWSPLKNLILFFQKTKIR